MLKAVNYLNTKWNSFVFWFHDASTKTGIRWLITLSIWAYDRLFWHLSDDWQLVCGVPFKEYILRQKLELARHQTRYFANYAYELQCHILFSDESDEEMKNEQINDTEEMVVMSATN